MEASKQEKTDNELIAEFMGGTFYGPNDDPDYANKWWFNPQPHEGYRRDAHHLTIGLRYDKDWSWLMPVVEKIDGMGYHVTIMRTRTIIAITLNVQNHIQSIHPGYSMIEVCYQAVVEFIKFYNTQKPLPL